MSASPEENSLSFSGLDMFREMFSFFELPPEKEDACHSYSEKVHAYIDELKSHNTPEDDEFALGLEHWLHDIFSCRI